MKIEEALSAFVRAIALDRAYQIAGDSCRGCGMPAVRTLHIDGHGGWGNGYVACSTCVPPREEQTRTQATVATLDELYALDPINLPAPPPNQLPSVTVTSVGRDFYLCDRYLNQEPNGTTWLLSVDPERWWFREGRFGDQISDHPQRRAVELLTRSFRGEP